MEGQIFQEIDRLQEEINSYRPFAKDHLQKVKDYYKIGLTYTSNSLEGNSLTESETKIIIEEGITIGGKPIRDHYEAIGHAEAYDFIYTLVKNKVIKEEHILLLHHLFYYRIDEKNAGKYRTVNAVITGSKYPLPKPDKIAGLMKEFIEKMASFRRDHHPVIAAALAHKEFVFIHPFIDGNGRAARLLMNLILLQHGYNIAIIPAVVRAEYIGSLEKAHMDDNDFIDLIARMVRETQKDYLRLFT